MATFPLSPPFTFMALKDLFSKKEEKTDRSYIVGTPKGVVAEQFKGEVEQKKDFARINSDVGDPHPFNYEITEKLYKEFGFVTGAVDKIVDFVWGPGFHTMSKDDRAKEIVDQWMNDVNFDSVGRRWLRESLIKGGGYLELAGKVDEQPSKVKVLNSNTMFIERDKKGNIKQYNQVIGKRGTKPKVISFDTFQVASLQQNVVGDCAYGYGMVYPGLKTINNLLGLERDLHTMMKRKAGAPIVIRAGDVNTGTYPSQAEVDSLAEKLQYINNKTEWVFPADIQAEVIEFGGFAERFNSVIDHDLDMLFFTFQIPEVLMGRGSIPEGLAQVQMDAFNRKIASIQVEVEKVIEEQIFTRVLRANGFQQSVEFEWGQPSNADKNQRIQLYTELLKNPLIGFKMRQQLEMQIAQLIGLPPEDVEEDEEEREREEDEAQPIVPGQNQNQIIIGDLIS